MTTLNDVDLPSDEEDDEYAPSAGEEEGSEGEDEQEKVGACGGRTKNSSKGTSQALAASVRSQKVNKVFDEMVKQTKQKTEHTPKVDGFMLQFQRRHADIHAKRNTTVSQLLHHLNISVGGLARASDSTTGGGGDTTSGGGDTTSGGIFSIRDFKKKCREADYEERDLIRQAVNQVDNAGKVSVDKTIRYAGKTYTIQQKMERNSSQYLYHQRMKEAEARKTAGGQMSGLDDILKKYDQHTSINAVQKSEADWITFKDKTGIEDDLSATRKDGFLQKRSFLNIAELRQHEKELQLKRRK
eukprot:GHVS01004776.1.p1 GENE.GHVS01004776.1~~GHVS01004776.1.p1  ORF type:complete len:299 (-),score=72.10 GHVS01004776.1:150-1046(-)